MKNLKKIIAACEGDFSAINIDKEMVDAGCKRLESIIDDDHFKVYGVNLFPGHMDEYELSKSNVDKYEDNFISSHCIESSEYYPDDLFKVATLCKIMDINRGELGVSYELTHCMLRILENGTVHGRIPKGLSYSSGDVIPGAHFTRYLREELSGAYDYKLKPGELMALVNGDFIQKARAIQLLPALHSFINKILINTFFIHRLSQSGSIINSRFSSRSIMGSRVIDGMNKALSQEVSYKRVQQSVSLRATGEVLAFIMESLDSFCLAIDDSLAKSSGNPLYKEEFDFPVSQASFLNFPLTSETGKVIDALIISMRSVQGRVNYLLSGKCDGVPLNAGTDLNPINLIQYPKALYAKFENLRMSNSTRFSNAQGQTSYGIEDLWTNGLSCLDQLEQVIHLSEDILKLESHVLIEIITHLSKGNSQIGYTDLVSNELEKSSDPTAELKRIAKAIGYEPPAMPWMSN